MKIINTKDTNFKNDFEEILGRGKVDIKGVSGIVQGIIDEIIEDGDKAVCNHIEKFDKWSPKDSNDLFINVADMEKAYNNLEPQLKASLHLAYERIEKYQTQI
jgi:histidinol dehydrogenase